jgi:ERCC4-type nuclease
MRYRGPDPIRPQILVDTREQTPLVFSAAVSTQRVTLATGDYTIAGASNVVAIERKSLPDLVMCVGVERERFIDCCRRLRDYPVRVLVVEAELGAVLLHRYRSETTPQSVIGTTIAIMADYHVPVMWCVDQFIAARWVEKFLVRVLRNVEKEAGRAA